MTKKISRRYLLKLGGATGVAAGWGLATGSNDIGSLIDAAPARRGSDESEPWFEASIPIFSGLWHPAN